MDDDYSHSFTGLIYIIESIPGPKEDTAEYEKLQENYNSQYDGCACKQDCNVPTCGCLQISHGMNYERFDANGKELYRLCWKNSYPIYECSNKCPCSSSCGNRLVQKGPIKGLIVKPCANVKKGMGLFTLNLILKGSFICEYAGEILTKSQALTRVQENTIKKRNNYIFCLNEHSTETTQTFVDPSQFGNIGRYINHSCDPNSCVVPVRCDTIIPKLAIFALKDIQPHEEIAFHYGTDCISKHSFQSNLEPIKCCCNTDICKGCLPFSDF